MTGLLTALGSGISAQKILEWLMRKDPDLAPKITKALASGLSAEKIVNFFSKDKNFEKVRSKLESQYSTDFNANPLVQSETIRGQNLGTDLASGAQRAMPGLIGTAGAVATGYALSRAIPAILQKGQTTSSLQTTQVGNQTQTPLVQQTQQPPIIPATPSQPSNSNILQSTQNVQSQGIPTNIPQILSKYAGFTKKIDELRSTGNDTQTITDYFRKFNPGGTKQLEKEAGQPLEKIIEEHIKASPIPEKKPIESQISPEKTPIESTPTKVSPSEPEEKEDLSAIGGMAKGITDNLYQGIFDAMKEGKTKFAGIEEPLIKKAKPLFDEGKIKSPEDLKRFANDPESFKEEKSIAKKDIVSSQDGIGEVKEIRNGTALVEIDGKLHKVKEDELKPPAFTEDEIADAYDNLMAKIPEEHKSGFISWAGYDEDRNVLGFIPRGGKYEELKNISPEEAQLIKEGKGVARTTGETREGLWVVGEDTRGGVISQIIHDRKEKYKKEEEKQLKFSFELPKKEKEDRGMKPVFDENAYARNLSRAREKKLKDEERARIKAEKEEKKRKLKEEKDEAKKRKKQT